MRMLYELIRETCPQLVLSDRGRSAVTSNIKELVGDAATVRGMGSHASSHHKPERREPLQPSFTLHGSKLIWLSWQSLSRHHFHATTERVRGGTSHTSRSD